MNEPKIQNLRRARAWVEDSGGELFRTFSSWEWFAREHRAELIRSGEFFPRPGRAGSLVGPGIDRVVLEIVLREAQKHAEVA